MAAHAIASTGAGAFASDRYLLCEIIGEGGMGRVYRAEQTALARSVAVKRLHPELARDPAQVRRFHQEARAASRLSHPGVVAIIEYGTSDTGEPFLVMEYVRGPNLSQVLRRRGPMSIARALAIVDQILSVLEEAHAAGVVHADIKSDNVLLDEDASGERVKIIDFGLAHLRSPLDDGEPVASGMVSGTAEYIAPEVIRGHVATPAADIYGVGIVLFELLTGTTPFGGGSPVQVLERHLRDEVVPPSLRRPDAPIPPALERAVARALAKRVEDRFADARSFRLALAAAMPAGACATSCSAWQPTPCAAAPHGAATRDFRPTLPSIQVAARKLRPRRRTSWPPPSIRRPRRSPARGSMKVAASSSAS